MAWRGFVVYHGEYDQLAALTDAEFRALLNALRQYSETGEVEELAGAAGMAFGFMSRSIDADKAKYQKRCDSGRNAVTARWDKARADDTDVYERIPSNESYTDDTNTKPKSIPKSIPKTNTKPKSRLSLSIDNSNAPVRDDDNDDLNGDLIEYITTNIGPLTLNDRAALREIMVEGMSAEMVRIAVDISRAHDAHTPSYAFTILNRWLVDGRLTPDSVKATGRSQSAAKDRPPAPRFTRMEDCDTE